jgi:hypothetical protein
MFVTLHFPGWLVHGGGGGGYIVNQAILAWSFASRFFCKTTKPILLDSLHITAAIHI